MAGGGGRAGTRQRAQRRTRGRWGWAAVGSAGVRGRGVIRGIYCFPAHWEEKERLLSSSPSPLLALPNVARELGSSRCHTLGSAWQPPGAAANVLGLQVLPGTKLDCDLLP